MAIFDETRFVERLTFFNGQRLFASDLQGIETFNSEMRWLHNRSLHQPGVGSGFAVSGVKGDRSVTIGPGYAIDAYGHEIILTRTITEPIPPIAGGRDADAVFYDLAVSYPEDAALPVAETRDGICLPRGAVRLREAPVFCWVRLEVDATGSPRVVDPTLAADIESARRIVLARIEVRNCRLAADISTTQRRLARPPTLPYIAAGEKTPADWQPWDGDSPDLGGKLMETDLSEMLFAYVADVDTSEAAFQNTPAYTIHIPGPRIYMVPSVISELGSEYAQTLAVDQVSIQRAGPNAFVAFLVIGLLPLPSLSLDSIEDLPDGVVYLPDGAAGDRELADQIVANWGLTWMGVEL